MFLRYAAKESVRNILKGTTPSRNVFDVVLWDQAHLAVQVPLQPARLQRGANAGDDLVGLEGELGVVLAHAGVQGPHPPQLNRLQARHTPTRHCNSISCPLPARHRGQGVCTATARPVRG